MSRPALILLNGLPGSGKSTVARAWCERHAADLPLALDVDVLRSMVGGWQQQPLEAGLAARTIAVAAVRAHLGSARDVVVPQLLMRAEFVDRLAAVASGAGAAFVHAVLTVPLETAEQRLLGRRPGAEGPLERPLEEVHETLEGFLATRPEARRITDEQGLEHLMQRARGT